MEREPGSTISISPGPSLPRFTVSAAVIGTAPASEATATTPSAVMANAAGRRPLRSTRAPTRCPSPKTMAAGPSHGARSGLASSGRGWWRPSGPAPMAAGMRCRIVHSRLRPIAVRASAASSNDIESEPSGLSSGPAARRRRAAEPARSAVRPRTCSRFPRTVLISPLWAISENGCARRHVGVVLVA